MQGIIFGGFAIILSPWNYNYFDDKLISNLYKFNAEGVKLRRADERLKKMNRQALDNPREYCRDSFKLCIPPIRVCQLDKRRRAFI